MDKCRQNGNPHENATRTDKTWQQLRAIYTRINKETIKRQVNIIRIPRETKSVTITRETKELKIFEIRVLDQKQRIRDNSEDGWTRLAHAHNLVDLFFFRPLKYFNHVLFPMQQSARTSADWWNILYSNCSIWDDTTLLKFTECSISSQCSTSFEFFHHLPGKNNSIHDLKNQMVPKLYSSMRNSTSNICLKYRPNFD